VAWNDNTIREILPDIYGCTVRSNEAILYDVSILGHDHRRVIRRATVANLDLEGPKSVAPTVE